MELLAIIKETHRPGPRGKVAKLNLNSHLRSLVQFGVRTLREAAQLEVALQPLVFNLDRDLLLFYDEEQFTEDLAQAIDTPTWRAGLGLKRPDDPRPMGVHEDGGLADLDDFPLPEQLAGTLTVYWERHESGSRIWVQIQGTVDGHLAESAPVTATSLLRLANAQVSQA